jgi:HPt (histidine-containing phosphotransfer) domain-containing protein
MTERDPASPRVLADPRAVVIPASEETLDPSVLAEFRQAGTPGSADFVTMLIDGFIEEAAEQLGLAKAACARADAGALKTAAHSLRGSAATMGARRLGALCAQMERHASGALDAAVASALMTDIDQEHVKVREALEAERHGARQE